MEVEDGPPGRCARGSPTRPGHHRHSRVGISRLPEAGTARGNDCRSTEPPRASGPRQTPAIATSAVRSLARAPYLPCPPPCSVEGRLPSTTQSRSNPARGRPWIRGRATSLRLLPGPAAPRDERRIPAARGSAVLTCRPRRITRSAGPRAPEQSKPGATRFANRPGATCSVRLDNDPSRRNAFWPGCAHRRWGTGPRRAARQDPESPHVRPCAGLPGPRRLLGWPGRFSSPR
jgi:hypothetical protein